MSDTQIYQLQTCSTGYGGCPVLQDLTFQIRSGEMVGLIGPNGAGKTTLLRLLAGDLRPLSGSCKLRGVSMTEWKHRQRARHIAYVPPSMELFSAMSVREFVSLGRTPHQASWQRLSDPDHRAIDRALEVVDATHLLDRDIMMLSEGEKHRVMIALGLAQEPEVLLLDEPTAHLDIKHAWQTMELIHRLHQRQGMTVILSSHDLNIASAFCSRLLLLYQGRVAADGSPAEVLEAERLTQVYDYPIHVQPGPPPTVLPRRQRKK